MEKIIGEEGYLPMSKTSWFTGIKEGKFPAPVKVRGKNYWSESEIFKMLRALKL